MPLYPKSLIPVSFYNRDPTRNATMSGISIATIIMEAGEKSGALRQADHCIKQGRGILIHYSLLQSSLLWPRKYIQNGAHTFKNIKEVFELLNKDDVFYKEV